jgi:hypothetical protein
MKYYLFQGVMMEVEEARWPILRQIEPSVVELTHKEYEERMGIKQQGGAGAAPAAQSEGMGAHPEIKAGAPFSGTRAEAIKILQERGFDYKDLKRKTKGQLIEML